MDGARGDEGLTLATRREGARVVVELVGELDLHESERLGAVMSEVMAEPTGAIELDAAKLTFTDSAGIRAMLVARADAKDRGIEFEVSRVSPPVDRILRIAGATDLLSDSG